MCPGQRTMAGTRQPPSQLVFFSPRNGGIAAGVLIVREAGGIVSDFENKDSYLKSGDIIAAAPKVFPEMIKIIQDKVKNSAYLNK